MTPLKKTQDQRIKRIEQILFHIHPLHLLNPLMAFGLFQQSRDCFY